ncbi:hypothetical protein L1987_29978 [Smallanthus sonchifolius]|uniref:Uncharacterized protein n=1 Tax=Smallanthus sonchifolius TaxID=185202 RepID=A0ACB9I285_9ASTR|nr:hypothetical protein L1987_29978 [Smallanthus sonchifolius]
MDLFGPISIRSIGGTKDENAEILQYLILSLESLCKLKKGIHHEFSAPYTPQQNEVAERKNRTLMETTTTMLSVAKLPINFWAEAVNTACQVLNRVLVVKSKHNMPPEPTGPARGFDYDALFKSFNLPDLSAEDDAHVYEYFNGGEDSNFSTRATVPIVTPDSNAASTSETRASDGEEVVHVDGNDAPADPITRVGNEAPVDPFNIKSSSSVSHDMGELSTNLDTNL